MGAHGFGLGYPRENPNPEIRGAPQPALSSSKGLDFEMWEGSSVHESR